MQIKFASQKRLTETSLKNSATKPTTRETTQDTYEGSCSDSHPVARPNPAWKSSITQNTQEAIAKIQAQLDAEWKFFGCQSYDKEGRKVKEGISEEDPRVFKLSLIHI